MNNTSILTKKKNPGTICFSICFIVLVFFSAAEFAAANTVLTDCRKSYHSVFSPYDLLLPYPNCYQLNGNLGSYNVYSAGIRTSSSQNVLYYCEADGRFFYYANPFSYATVREDAVGFETQCCDMRGKIIYYFYYQTDAESCSWVCKQSDYVVNCSTCGGVLTLLKESYNTKINCAQTNPETGLNLFMEDQCRNISDTCDGRDNNCNGATDEGFNVGAACPVGIGACKRDGVLVCSPDKTGTVCSVTAGKPSPEICGDTFDSDCDGDNDKNCTRPKNDLGNPGEPICE